MAADTLLGHAGGALVHRIEGERGAEAAADAYDAVLNGRVAAGADGVPVLDVVVLGIGEDGHTASLFPGNPALSVRGRSVVAVHDAPKPPPDRVSLTLEVLRAARSCVLLASGADKAAPLARVLSGHADPMTPASELTPATLQVVADAAALGRG
jgi:6-phosphogluconolactonase